jgi:hypothetical protein
MEPTVSASTTEAPPCSTVRLMGAMIDDHARRQGRRRRLKADIQHFADGVFLDGVQLLDVGVVRHKVIAGFLCWF